MFVPIQLELITPLYQLPLRAARAHSLWSCADLTCCKHMSNFGAFQQKTWNEIFRWMTMSDNSSLHGVGKKKKKTNALLGDKLPVNCTLKHLVESFGILQDPQYWPAGTGRGEADSPHCCRAPMHSQQGSVSHWALPHTIRLVQWHHNRC